MARVDFYLLGQAGAGPRQVFACRLAEKAYRLEHTVHIHVASQDEAQRLDDLLWTFRDGSFVPHHQLAGAAAATDSPVTIGCSADPVKPRDLLINLCDEIPACAESFPRVAELVTSDAECKQHGRKRFAAYREKGHTLETHNV
ncbi:MAG TPA: DNA polymerase III subunit chi [Woeseiaceae bacterium]|jgi:DNA polymerase-3 subunit chi|nr:DNA polymerase III subunit chi [Woeseiaceae bacterium]